ncbi:fatty acid kinase [Cytobacillus horneckiae]|uniref:DhaL domain-containing protein n=1 Tax=Cytobacillus horneckiae TaxID=549687 RepID=A0A2N0ZM72_9BACI|nr:DAK2 domain-containing protein [Cytobacillus horneckiae]NRG45643.1 DAK2 domain-containing protein [Bacillus sp. CRN 9]MBN6887118.1 DAK2 domain-containing protein [Cytobacillus horneckiae]MCM3178291.1 DAK2 domain-containing protein [Cytobacillus horneckiae]MEC1156969.1 DAK2 domain-containing protein [Cytobacillus horneckiae]MED2940005.1 DAK2 domain-containing protein [Cytobacillus horneckiae]
MSIKVLDGKQFARMIVQGANHLSANAKYVDALNVFPVPDGDTGTNMNLSMTSGAKEVKNHANSHIGKVGVALSKGLLMGARGNSGVILSQLFRGFSKSIEHKESLNGSEFAAAFEAGVETAYKAVMKPVEGTILTVAKDAGKKAVQAAQNEDDIIVIMEAIVKEAKASLDRTPDLLPVLKEVGVVDSGGQGLLFVYEGFLAELKGEKLPDSAQTLPKMDDLVNAEHHKSIQSHMNTEDIVFGYCTEFMVRFESEKIADHPFSEEQFRQDLSKLGDSLLVIADEDLVKVHIHSEQPGDCLSYGQRYGNLINMKIENMRLQHTNILDEDSSHAVNTQAEKPAEKLEYGIVTVSMGSGVADLFRSIGAHAVIEGGQTMNPSTEDIVKAIKEVNAEKVIILPNNKNIIMAAQQAAEVTEEEAIVIPSKTVPQGMSALLAFNPGADLSENEESMSEALAHVKTGQITYAVRDTSIDGLEIEKGDFMGIDEGKIVVKDKDKVQSAINLLSSMIDEEAEILTIIKGEDATDEEVESLVAFIEEKYEEIEVEVHNGKQPLYAFIFSIE